MAEIETEKRDSSAARVPSVPPGKAIVVTRYDEEKAVVLNPEDFKRLRDLDRDLDELARDPTEVSELALKAHAIEDAAGTPIEDPDRIKTLLGM